MVDVGTVGAACATDLVVGVADVDVVLPLSSRMLVDKILKSRKEDADVDGRHWPIQSNFNKW
jgi:shikimate kinase